MSALKTGHFLKTKQVQFRCYGERFYVNPDTFCSKCSVILRELKRVVLPDIHKSQIYFVLKPKRIYLVEFMVTDLLSQKSLFFNVLWSYGIDSLPLKSK